MTKFFNRKTFFFFHLKIKCQKKIIFFSFYNQNKIITSLFFNSNSVPRNFVFSYLKKKKSIKEKTVVSLI